MIKAVPLSLKEANAYIDENHRHHAHAQGDKFRVGAEVDGVLVGVAQCGRPVGRYLDDGKTLEVIRLCTNGSRNVCSFLYSRCARIAQEMGYERIITYILSSENGASLTASGWYLDKKEAGGAVGIPFPVRETLLRHRCPYSHRKRNIPWTKNSVGQRI